VGNEHGSTPIFGDIANKVLGRVDDVASKSGIPDHLRAGNIHEAERLAELGLEKNTGAWRPSQADIDSAAFDVIVGEPKYTTGGLPKGTIFDATDGGLLEIKGGSSSLSSSYQLRLQTYKALREGQSLTIETTRPINSTFADWLQRWDVNTKTP
jgi:hypothetical protein